MNEDEWMNILVINGSPKGGSSNSLKLAHAFLSGAGWSGAETVTVADTEIAPCLGCFSCWNKTPGTCVIHDGMSGTLAKIIAADVVIWTFPLYYFSVPGKLKNLIDRQLPVNLPFMAGGNQSGGHPPRYDLSRQRHIVISTCGFWTAEGNYDAVISMFNRYYGVEKCTWILCGQGELFRVPELSSRTGAYLETVRRAGAEFAAGGINAETDAELAEPLYPRDVFEKMADASWGIAESGETQADEGLNFTKQMAALYRPDGKPRVLEFCYTDLGKTYQILLTAQGSEVITDHFRQYTTRIETPFALWRSIARGEISGPEALFRRQYKVLGDFSLMLRWDELFGASGSQRPAPEKRTPKESPRGTNMAVLLIPWMAVWIGAAINPVAGGAAGVVAAACVPLIWMIFKPVVFERISVALVAALSLAAILGQDARAVITLSYGMFGLMWLAGAFTKTPLTAYYSAAGYGGEKAFGNPLFMRTNRILTAAWSALYLVTPIWTYFLMGTRAAAYTGLINAVCPILMGIFTAWFQKWYPARWAK
ncbi:MAG: flavodoxin family protein [Peptococcaceae bacterium]|jgi:multimeric flavodoxin WrbA|nr:flavodoxin family protein [Peptococcaceae bacterium]